MVKYLKIIFHIICAILFPILIFYTGKFYIDKHLNFEYGYLVLWTVVIILISISLIIGCYALKSLHEVKKQNEELKLLIQDLTRQTENNHYESMRYAQNSRELFMEDDQNG